jgi:hypothetical protein
MLYKRSQWGHDETFLFLRQHHLFLETVRVLHNSPVQISSDRKMKGRRSRAAWKAASHTEREVDCQLWGAPPPWAAASLLDSGGWT